MITGAGSEHRTKMGIREKLGLTIGAPDSQVMQALLERVERLEAELEDVKIHSVKEIDSDG